MSDPLEISEETVAKLLSAALDALKEAKTVADLKEVRGLYIGENAPLTRMNALLKDIPQDQRAAAGKIVGQARARLGQAFAETESRIAEAESAAKLVEEAVDVTTWSPRITQGARHPVTMLQEQAADVFVSMGWEIAEGPELEHEWFNFDSLNFDEDHPARALQDTFFVEPVDRRLLLRTHTSPVQMRSLLSRPLPLYVVAPGKTFRTDELDATHMPAFSQIEGIAIDKNITMAHLKGVLLHFAKAMFGEEAKVRLRANYFPFTEPSAEFDLWHPNFKEGPRWIEWGGCGMVHPNVLRSAGVDPEIYQGFAFGMGIERTLMFRADISDMREMVEGDIRFSKQFGVVS